MYTPRDAQEEKILEEVKMVIDPDLRVSLYDLGLIYDIKQEDGIARVRMTLTSMGCPASGMLKEQIVDACLRTEGVETADVQIVWSPPWDPRTMATENGKDALGIFDF